MDPAFHIFLDPNDSWVCQQKGGRGIQCCNMLCARTGGGFDTTHKKDMLLRIKMTIIFPNVMSGITIAQAAIELRIKADYKVSKTHYINMEWNTVPNTVTRATRQK